MAETDIAKLDEYGLLQVTGEDARAFLHAQLTNDVANLEPGRACVAGWCSAKGRLLATFLVVPFSGGFLLQLSRDLVPSVAKRLQMFVLRSKVKIADATGLWAQFGVWESGTREPMCVTEQEGLIRVAVEPGRSLALAAGPAAGSFSASKPASDWTLAEIRAGRARIALATQDQFVPQMVNLELAGGVDFRKGCYPGQEIVARAQYRGAVKRRMVRLGGGGALQPGQELYSDDQPGHSSGTVVNAAGGESLAVLMTDTVEAASAVRVQPGSAALQFLPLPYSR